MFFYHRDPYYRVPRGSGCFVSLLITLIIAAALILGAIYIGTYVLAVLLIIGVIIGGLTAIFSLFKAIPQTIKDMSSQIYRGNKAVALLKKIGYFFVCVTKYSVSNDVQYAKNAFQRFVAQRVLSFSKWINLALGITVFVFGLLILLCVIAFAVLLIASALIIVLSAIVVSIVIMLAVGFLYNLFFVAKEAIRGGKRSFSPICFKFVGRCYFSDLLSIPKTFIIQMGKWIGATWTNSMNFLGSYKSWLNKKRWIWFSLAIGFIISCPISAVIFIAASSIIIFVLALLIYLINAIWIIIKALFKF